MSDQGRSAAKIVSHNDAIQLHRLFNWGSPSPPSHGLVLTVIRRVKTGYSEGEDRRGMISFARSV